ncbi:hypothetical protein AURDEDRAFT_74181, partial [Auricularia subglabra TFB-10046 SS5]
QNIVGSCDVKFPIRLAYSHGQFSSYEPKFPGLISRMLKPKVILLMRFAHNSSNIYATSTQSLILASRSPSIVFSLYLVINQISRKYRDGSENLN